MNTVSTADWIIIVGYLAGVIAFGVWFGRGQKNTRDYFLGSRDVPWWGVGLSIVATETSALTFIGVPALAYGKDHLTFIQIVIGYVIARIILAILIVPHYFRGEIYSPYQLFARAFGESGRRLAGGFFLLAGTLAAGVRVYVTCIPIKLMLGIDILPAIGLFVFLSLIYTYVGGIKAVIWTDVTQFVLFMLGGIFALCYVPTFFAGGWSEVFQLAREGGKLAWFNPSFSWSMPFNIWMGIIGATFLVMSSHGADQLIVQRVLTCRSVSEGRKSLFLSAVIILPLFLLFLLTGTVLWVYYQSHALGLPIPEVRPGVGQNDYIFPIFILTVIPPLLKGVLVVAILSAAMSSVSSALAALASVSTMDFLKGLFKVQRSEAFFLRFSKYSTVFWALVLIQVAIMTQHVESVLKAAFTLNGLTSGAMLGGLILAVLWRRGPAAPLFVGMISSLVVMLAINPIWNPKHSLPWLIWEVQIAWPWYTLIGTAVTLVVATLTRRVFPAPGPRPGAPARKSPRLRDGGGAAGTYESLESRDGS